MIIKEIKHKREWLKPEVIIICTTSIEGGGHNNLYNEGQFYGANHSHIISGGGPVSHVSGFFNNYVS